MFSVVCEEIVPEREREEQQIAELVQFPDSKYLRLSSDIGGY